MAEARMRERWNHTSQILAMLVNVNRDPSSTPVRATAFHPYFRLAKKNNGQLTRVPVSFLREIFLKKK